MKLGLSREQFTEKPQGRDFTKINYFNADCTIKEIMNYLHNGRAISAVFVDGKEVYTQSSRKASNFLYTTFVMVDCDDDTHETLDDLIKSLMVIPTIAYETFSHKKDNKGNRYRLLYFFEEPICAIEVYQKIYDLIVTLNQLQLKDNCGRNPMQLVLGTKPTANVYNSGKLYQLKMFGVNITLEKDEEATEAYNKKMVEETEKSVALIKDEIEINDEEYINDFFQLKFEDLLEKYRNKYYFFDHTPLPEVSDDTPYILLPDNYISINRYIVNDYTKDADGNKVKIGSHIHKNKNGEQRRKKIYLSLVMRRYMIPNVTFEHLLQNALYELAWFTNNSQDKITRKDLVYITKNAMNTDLSKYPLEKFKSRCNGKFIVNNEYCIKHGLSAKQARQLSRKLITFEKIGEYYDTALSLRKNQELLEEKGVKVSVNTLQRFKEYQGI